jgi:uncharacterized membrane protein YesL
MSAAVKVLGWALVGLYDEALPFLKANVAWFFVSLPFGLPLLALLSILIQVRGGEEQPGIVLALLASGFLLLLVPNPASLGVYRLAAVMQHNESPSWGQFWTATRRNVGLGLALYFIGVAGVVVLAVAASFYLRAEQPLLQALSLLYFYLGLFWLALQLYLGPLVTLFDEYRLLGLYRRAALLVLAHPIYSLAFLLAIGTLMLLCLIAVPLFPALAMSFVALVGSRALYELKLRYDPRPDADEETA